MDIISIVKEFIVTVDKNALKKKVEYLKYSKPILSRAELCEIIIRDEALFCGIVGAGASLIPGPLSWMMCAPDIINLLAKQSKVILSVAYVYGHDPSSQERIIEILACLGFTSGIVAGNEQMKQMIIAGLKSGLVKEIARNIGIVLSKRVINSFIPFIGSVTGGIFNYTAILSVGKAAISYYGTEN